MSTVSFRGITKRFANGFEAVSDLDLDVEDGELLVVVGPSGCGKTTLLRMLAGLEDVTEGEILIDGQRVNDRPPRDRDIAMVFQNYALYPHLTVGANIGYPLRIAGMSKGERAERVQTVARQLRLDELLDRKPRQLSGGQRQRVAMGRAMVRQPKVFLMDEPLSNLDAKLRVVMRAEVAELQRSLGTTMFYVTHDQTEAMTMGHRVAVMTDGRLQQVAPPTDLYQHPANAFVAGFIGSPPMNLAKVRLDVTGDAARLVSGDTSAELPDSFLDALPALRTIGDGHVMAGVRPEHLRISPDGPGFPATVRLVEPLGSEHIVHLDLPGAHLLAADGARWDEIGSDRRLIAKRHGEEAGCRAGDRVVVSAAPEHVRLFDCTTGAAVVPTLAGATSGGGRAVTDAG
ncbi:MAG: ABC transporter ATP-binding protein [Acidimicrobiales bacterium]